MSALARLQRDFQQHVLSAESQIAPRVTESAAVSVNTRLAIYAEAYRLRLIEALANNYPRLQRWLGEEPFATIALDYIARHPSRLPSIRWYGESLPIALELSHSDCPWLADMARWEWALATAFDAADSPPLSVEAMAAVAPQDWPHLRFGVHPSVRLLHISTNAPALCKAMADEAPAPEPVTLGAPQPWLIWRATLTTQFRSLDPPETAALDCLWRGGTFEAMCEVLCEWRAPGDVPLYAAGLLKQWVSDGMLTRKEVDG